MPGVRRPEGMAGCPRGAKTRETENRSKKTDRKRKEIEKERKKENKFNFIVNIEESVRKSQISQGSSRVGVFLTLLAVY